ncbi:MAG: fused MFS/spermidine synthase [Pseudomonadota bacterium]
MVEAPAASVAASEAGPRAAPGSVLGLAATLTLVSAASMAVEIVAGRALAPYVGMSLYSWTIIIAVVLTGLSIGHWVGGVAADRAAKPHLWIGVSLLLAAATTIISLGVLRLLEPAVSGADPISHLTALTVAAFFAPSFFAGVLAPLLTKAALSASPPSQHGRVLGLFFALGAAGAILGTLLAGLVLISWLGARWSMMSIGAVYALLALPYFRGARGRALASLAAAAALAPGAFVSAPPCARESGYYCIRIDPIRLPAASLAGSRVAAEAGPEEEAARVMALDHLAHGVNHRDDPLLLLSPYVHGVDELIRRRFPGPSLDAFFIGGGAYTLPRAWLARYPTGRMVVAEIDPDVTRLAHERLWTPRTARLETIVGDGRQALRTLPPDQRFDVIFGDAFHDISIPQHLTTDEFNAAVKARLRPGGVYVVNVVDLLRAPRFMTSFAQTLRRRFASVELWIDVAEIGPNEKRTTWIVLASDAPSRFDDLEREGIESRYGPRRRWARLPAEAMINAVGAEAMVVLTDDYSPVGRLLAPVLLSADAAE